MIRALSLTCLAALAVPAVAEAKPQICILGLEVKDPNGAGITQDDAKTASNLTTGLRNRAKIATGPYEFAGKQSERELVDLTMVQGCTDSDEACMARIGTDLGCDHLMYGSIQKDTGGKGAYTVRLRMLNVKSREKAKITIEKVPISAAQNEATLSGVATKLYRQATGQSSLGVLVVKANVDRGTVLVDGEPKGNIVNGEATIEGLSAGRYKLAIEADGFRRFEKSIQIEDDKTRREDVTLDKAGGEVKIKDGTGGNSHDTGNVDGISKGTTTTSSPWKKLAIGSAVATGVLAIGFGVSWYELSQTGSYPGFLSYGSKCPKSGGPEPSQCNLGDGLKITTYATAFGVAAAGGVMIWAIVKAKTDAHGNEHARRGRAAKPEIVVTPVVSPAGAGATLRFDW